jgi:hypothetical protein
VIWQATAARGPAGVIVWLLRYLLKPIAFRNPERP